MRDEVDCEEVEVIGSKARKGVEGGSAEAVGEPANFSCISCDQSYIAECHLVAHMTAAHPHLVS